LDHPLTPIALLELADVNFRLGDTKSAAYLALEASYSAAIFNQYDVMEEALSLGTMLHLSSKTAGPYPPLENAIVWSRKNRALLPQASLMIRLAECYSEAGDSASSARILGDAIKAFNARSGFGSGNLEGRANYLAAVNLFIDGDFDQGLARLQRALKEFTPVSRWIYQLRLTEAYAVSGAISERHAEVMYESLLRDPTELEWRSDPIEAITFLATPHLDSIRRWMGIVASKRDFQQLIAIAELFRRHRFYTELPLAGRDLGLRWTMHAPEQALTTRALNQRVDFFTRYPAYKTLSDQIEQIRQKLANQPLQETPGSPEQKEQVNQYVELMQQCKKAEALLASIGLRREPSEMVFPPQPILLELSKILQPNQTVVYVIATPNQHLFLEYTTRGTRLMASIPNKDMFAILKNIFSDTTLEDRQLDPKVLEKDDWHKMVTEVAQTLIPDIVLEYYGEAPPELIIIPDGLAWYLPFEMLRVPGGEAETQWLWQAARMRYSPTLGLAVQPQRPSRPWRRTAFFTGNLSDTVKPEIAAAAFAQLHQAFPAIVDFPERLDIPSAWFGSTCDEFVVWTQLGRLPKGGPFALTPVIKDRASNGSNLASWLSLPWRGAEHLILPTFESEAANGVKGKPDGDELFLLTTGLMASGSRTILLSRWTTGGKSTLDFTTDYWQLARDQSPVVAYQEALRKTQDRPVEFAMEPRIASSKEPLEGKATHPVFWAGYMLFDIPTVPGIPLPEPPDQDLKLPAEGQQDQDEQDDVDDDAMKKEGDGDGGDGGGNAGDNGRGDGGAGLGS
jgi:tetratricopeptide (TPR) repeat protein